VFVRPPEIFYAELKTEKGRLTAHQRAWLKVLEECGQEVHVWRPSDLDDAHERLKRKPQLAA
jgi:hypothetical protein